MSSSESEISRDDPRLNEILARYLQAAESGEPIDREQFIREHAEYVEELREFFADKSRIDEVVGKDAAVAADRRPIDAPTLPPESVTRLDAPTLDSVATRHDAPRPGAIVRYFGDYELLDEIARGGMGVVYKARQVKLNRVVAIKMILSGQLASKEDVQRFYTEAEAAAGLDHPGIVPIYEVGEHEGQHYFSMGFVDGESLSSRLSDGPLPPREAAALLADVCGAIQYAHDRGVIHRDLKPANILLQKEQNAETQSRQGATTGSRSGRPHGDSASSHPGVDVSSPKVTDFGLAKKLKGDSNLTAIALCSLCLRVSISSNRESTLQSPRNQLMSYRMLTLIAALLLCTGCQKTTPTPAPAASSAAASPANSAIVPADPAAPVATLLAKPVYRRDCLSQSSGIGSVGSSWWERTWHRWKARRK